MTAQNLTLREAIGPSALVRVGPFGELEAAVGATTELRMGGASFDAAGPAVMPYPGVIVGMTAACEAGSNFTAQPTVDGTADTGTTLTVNSAVEVQLFTPANFVPFTAGQTIGVDVIADTTSKDVFVDLWVVFDLSAQ